MIQVIENYLTEYRTQEEIIKELKRNGIEVNSRQWRNAKEQWNNAFLEDKTDKCLVHSNNGFKLTANEEEIRSMALDYRHRALDMLKKYWKCSRYIENSDNIKIDELLSELEA